ncbi:hypothetical protein BJG93_08820 [Paraburkholderia sprentiae WSM5005]|uniref:Uncharacterized protein n=1 Tax=Paraburkholderia sprentiae WSM5005 TaxID=754502 RepID=A0A1I9YGN7_9BURK|nr:hypothetical protein [Paraburkholderia sprentiae]APA85470.1 hypothetical protein BJG93_08820 [Paraburkholderia sprentiae WSM5005]
MSRLLTGLALSAAERYSVVFAEDTGGRGSFVKISTIGSTGLRFGLMEIRSEHLPDDFLNREAIVRPVVDSFLYGLHAFG